MPLSLQVSTIPILVEKNWLEESNLAIYNRHDHVHAIVAFLQFPLY